MQPRGKAGQQVGRGCVGGRVELLSGRGGELAGGGGGAEGNGEGLKVTGVGLKAGPAPPPP